MFSYVTYVGRYFIFYMYKNFYCSSSILSNHKKTSGDTTMNLDTIKYFSVWKRKAKVHWELNNHSSKYKQEVKWNKQDLRIIIGNKIKLWGLILQSFRIPKIKYSPVFSFSFPLRKPNLKLYI